MPAHRDQLLPASPEALYRFQVVGAVLVQEIGGAVRADAVREATARTWLGPDGRARTVSRSSVYRWVRAWELHGVTGLEPRTRKRTETSEALSEDFLDFFVAEHDRDRGASLPELIRRARQTGVIAPAARVHRSTVWRAAKRMGLDVRRRKAARDCDTRRYRYRYRMQLVLADGKHFRVGTRKLKRVVLFFLDNATRFGLNAVVGTSETAVLFLRGLYEVVARHGRMDGIYVDRGPGFIALDTYSVAQKLNVAVKLGRKAYPAGHGAIERLNQTAKADLLRNWVDNDAIDPSCESLELRAKHFLREVYNHAPHGGLGDETPHQRWTSDERALRFYEDDEALRARFLVEDSRRVTEDHIIPVDGVAYEVPRGHAGARISFWRQVLDDHLYVLHEGRLVRIHPVDLHVNATSGRGRQRAPEPAPSPVPSAADLAYERDFGPVTGPDGGFTDQES